FSFDCLTGANRSDGTLGTNTQRVYVDNPNAVSGAWNLTMAATSTAVWTDGGSNSYDFNDPTGSGCTDSADADLVAGQMTVDPTVGSITTDYSGSDVTGISLQSADAFAEGVKDSITLVAATAGSADIWRGYFKGIDIKNTIPAEQAPAVYTLSFTLTATAL
ncbi:MAG: hypothetical protein PHU42_02145, partial [Patescibacteria group bacterium]|nr:hypothetical protein [Patescibacteria group bacterium]